MGTEIGLQSSSFAAGDVMPRQHTGEGEDISPQIGWGKPPPKTKELALICEDPDAPQSEPWVHWVIYKIDPALRSLPEGVKVSASPANVPGALQGKNSWGSIGYRGPLPPRGHGIHHYIFTLYALDYEMPLPPGANKQAVLGAMRGHILGEGRITGLYQRP